MYGQDVLRDHLARRIAGSGASPSTVDVDAAVRRAAEGDVTAVAVLRSFSPAGFAASALDHARSVPDDRRSAWFAAFTRTVFLAGNPENLADRFAFDRCDGSVAWLWPARAGESVGLRRLLKTFPGTAPISPEPFLLPGGNVRTLYVATEGRSVSDYLVDVNHTLAEAVLTGLLGPDDGVAVCPVPVVDETLPGRVAALRVHRAPDDAALLAAYTCLTEPLAGTTRSGGVGSRTERWAS